MTHEERIQNLINIGAAKNPDTAQFIIDNGLYEKAMGKFGSRPESNVLKVNDLKHEIKLTDTGEKDG